MRTHILTASLCLALMSVLDAAEKPTSKQKHNPAVDSPTGTPTATLSNINRIAAWYSANGEQERIPSTGNAGLTYPRLTATAMYSAGLMWGGIFNDGRTPVLRVNGQSYINGTKPGAILGLRTGNAENPANADVRIWRVRKDYSTADLRQDAAEINMIPIGSVTEAMITAVRNQYARDWGEWPWQKGAPFYDVGYRNISGVLVGANNGVLDWGEDLNHNGVLDSGEDVNNNGLLDAESPGIANADQVIWYVCNDIGVAQPWTCPETGMEEQATIWAYNTTSFLGNVIFKRFRLIYKGIASTPANATIDSMYLCQWSDPDVGDAGDDFAGCDTSLSLGYAYNANATDVNYQQYGLRPPAIGKDFFQGPMKYTGNLSDTAIFDFKKVPGARNLPMTSFIYFAAGGHYNDPPFSYNGAVRWYQMLRGFPPTPQGPPDPPRVVNPVTGQPTAFWLSGDPLTRTGWLDGSLDNPGDRRFLLSSGPFRMAVGDTQEIVVGVIAGLGSSNIGSISVLRYNAENAQVFFSSLVEGTTVNVSDYFVPTEFELFQNYPNPFNPSTTIRYKLPVASRVTIRIYNLLGQEVKVLHDGVQEIGDHQLQWDGRNNYGLSAATGVYFYRIVASAVNQSNSFIQVKTMILLR